MNRLLQGRNILLGITGGIAAYKAAEITSRFVKEGARVKVIMTRNALRFIQPLTLETLSGNPVYIDTFEKAGGWGIDHISLAKWADVVLVAPATANILAKSCYGLADDLLSTTLLAVNGDVFFAPAMNTRMYTNQIVQNNIEQLKGFGFKFILPASGRLACGDWGEGKLADIEDILEAMVQHLTPVQPLKGVNVLVTAGPTREAIDPVRFISNPSTGKMGYALAEVCRDYGAEVSLVTGPTALEPPAGVKVYKVDSAVCMHEQVMALYTHCSLVLMSAAVGDYRASAPAVQKMKKNEEIMTLELIRNPDILKEMGACKQHQILVGFAAETENVEAYARRKIEDKNLDFILANDVTLPGTGFQYDTNQGLLIAKNGEVIPIPYMDKKEFARKMLNEVLQRISLEA